MKKLQIYVDTSVVGGCEDEEFSAVSLRLWSRSERPERCCMKDKKKTFDAVAFMRKRRDELSRAYAGLSAEQIEQ
jgi:hypothetical protein